MSISTRIAALAATLVMSALAPDCARAAATFNTCLSNFYYQDMMRSGDPANCYGAANATFVAVNIFNTTPYSVYFTLQGNKTDLSPSQGGAPQTIGPTAPSPQANDTNLQAPYIRFCSPPASAEYNGYEQYWGVCTLTPQGGNEYPANPFVPFGPQSQAYVLQNGMVLPPYSQIQLTYLPAAATGGTAGAAFPTEMLQDAQLTIVMAGPGVARKGVAPTPATPAIGISFLSGIISPNPVSMTNTIFNPTATGSDNSAVTTSQQVIYAGGYAYFNAPSTAGMALIPSPYLGSPSHDYDTWGGIFSNADLAMINNLAPGQAAAQPYKPATGQFAMVLRGTMGAPPLGGGPPAFNVQIGMNAANVIGLHQPNASQVQTSILTATGNGSQPYTGLWTVQQGVPAISP